MHVFVTKRAELVGHLEHLREELVPDGYVWISWPRRASKVATNVTEDVIREVALPLGMAGEEGCSHQRLVFD